MTMQNAATGTIRCAGAMTAHAARILSGNAAPAFLAAYPDNTARLEAGNAPGRQKEESYKRWLTVSEIHQHIPRNPRCRACGTYR